MNTKASSTALQDATTKPAPKNASKRATSARKATADEVTDPIPAPKPAEPAKPVQAAKATKATKVAKADKPSKPAQSSTPTRKAQRAPKATQPAKPVASKAATSSAPAAAAPASAAIDAAQGKHAKKAPKPRPVLVRDSFTMPEDDFALILKLKAAALGRGRAAKKSELLRAGLRLLSGMDAESLVVALDRLETVKTGRPKKGH